ncbi:hypothetical protein D0812_27575 [Vibrio owensii]|uniref:Uncharacterized protein n=1 Tax=Vibrio owensii TaxID=696485 RepID=A0AAP9GBV9_9VIBR|nr:MULTISPECIES: hypothetical protein [Vibrio harveyi group]AYO18103.1 hypothetical protein D0812_27575 [Vibrio owensii]MBE3866055.1 hypothetical protein [Vibrio parahaemolyticus]MCR9653435.1 hypothetical protein [Vibrio parahaemolyticus]QGH47254.1 hypothetical protein APZ19_09225 [Vibrio owensii]TOK09493.1 hypothetical protein CGI25_07935 [Vibrio parahaemolyticus]
MKNDIELCRERIGTKYDPVLHEKIRIQLTGLIEEAERAHEADEIDYDMIRAGLNPIVSILNLMSPQYTKDFAELTIVQVIACCRVMGILDSKFYTSKLFVLCETFIKEISNNIDVYESTLGFWLAEAKSKPELC